MRGMRDPILSFFAVAAVALGLHYGLQYLPGGERQTHTQGPDKGQPKPVQEPPELAQIPHKDSPTRALELSKTQRINEPSKPAPQFDLSLPKDLAPKSNIKLHEEFYNDSYEGANQTRVSNNRLPAARSEPVAEPVAVKVAEPVVVKVAEPVVVKVAEPVAVKVAEPVVKKEPPRVEVAPEIALAPARHGGKCEPFEYPGISAKGWELNQKDWNQVVTLFNDAKGALAKWAQQHAKDLGNQATVRLMQQRVQSARLYAPGHAINDPDLSWRGIGIWSNQGDHVGIHLGVGFIQLAVNEAQAARFELTRLLAQSWSPCELSRLTLVSPWGKLLACLKVKDQNHCEAGTNAESGWAVSTVLAHKVSPRKCRIRAFTRTVEKACVMSIPLGLSRKVAGQ